MRRLPFLAALPLVLATACSQDPPIPPMDQTWLAELQSWRAEREARLMAPDGWLSLIGLTWLDPGENLVGSAPEAKVQLPADAAPARVATLVLESDRTVQLVPEPGVELLVDDQPAVAGPIASDAEGDPDQLSIDRILFYLIDRDGRIGARIKDPQAPTRTAFAGLDWYEPNPSYKVEARLEMYAAPKEVTIPTVLGSDSIGHSPGLLRFSIGGEDLTLEPLQESPEAPLFLIFRDATNGEETYGAGRFLYADPPIDGVTVLDFNRAYNPPCAFTPFATCPLPPPENRLSPKIEAGEKYHGEAH